MIVDGFLDWAERVDGPANKQFPQPNSGKGIACHSVVGNLPNHAVPGRFFDPDDQASVMFILYKDGHVIQMYPVTSSTWTSGSFAANTNYWAIEAEGGGYPNTQELLTQPAEDSFVRIVTEWENHTGRKALINENILQHKQLVAIYGGGATACASDRYSNAWARINEGERYGESMTPEEKEMLYELTRAMTGFGEPTDALPRLKAWNYSSSGDFTGNSLLDGYTGEQQKLGQHLADHPGSSKVGKHDHPSTVGENQ